MKEYKKAIGETIRKFRESQDLSQTEFAVLAFNYPPGDGHAGQRKISKFETGQQEPRISEIIIIAKALGVDCNLIVKHALKIHKP